MKKEFISPKGVHPTSVRGKEPRYSHAAKVGNTIYVSGQVGIKENGEVPESFEEQCVVAFENLKKVLEAAGASLEDVVKTTGYFVNYLRDFDKYHEIKARYFGQPMPACTNIQINYLAFPDLLVEIEAIAVTGEEV